MQLLQSFIVAAGLAAAVTAAGAQTPKTQPQPSSADTEFVQKAAAAGKKEVAQGTMAASKASNKQVKQYAQTLVKDHTAANQQLTAIARRKNITIPDQPGNDGRAGGTADTRTSATKAGGKPSATGSTTGTTGASGGVMTTGERNRQSTPEQTEPWMSQKGIAFDRGFIEAQVKAHQEAIELFDQEAKNGSDAELKAFAQKQLPGLRNHLKQAQDLQAKLSTSTQ